MPTTPATSRLAVATYALPGPTITSTGRDALGAVGHRRDRLRATDPVDLVDADERRGGERGGGDPAVGGRRHAEHELGHAGHPSRDRGHQHGGRVGGAAAGHVEPGPIDGDGDLAHVDPVAQELDGGLRGLLLVVGANPLGGVLERGTELRGRCGERVLELGRRTRRSSTVAPSNRAVSSRRAASPRSRTAAMISRTDARVSTSSSTSRASTEARSDVPRRSSRVSTVGSW